MITLLATKLGAQLIFLQKIWRMYDFSIKLGLSFAFF